MIRELLRKALDPTGLPRVVIATVAGTLFCVGVALFIDSFRFADLSEAELRRAIVVNIGVPTALAAPLLFLLMSKIRQLALAHRELEILASTDHLTGVLNRGAFTMLVEAYLEKAAEEAHTRAGALLIADVDHFKAINDQLGHESGDRVLQAIAKAIKGALRGGDLVGRLGGEEFGAFLPGANAEQALNVAERLRSSVREIPLLTIGLPRPISVSVGAVSFKAPTSFEAIYVAADKELYRAKQAGRDRVELRQIIDRAAA